MEENNTPPTSGAEENSINNGTADVTKNGRDEPALSKDDKPQAEPTPSTPTRAERIFTKGWVVAV